ncbi:DUF2333 family protein [Roseobacter sp. HKCCD9010]|uniref:DUF2333 family protein n=1 Tax=unclassified Roseobacter TaxID=196798 RepID=UPI001492FBE2|nr:MULTISPECIES: DUF2333 family protein [unclassified Roseobacter]MBF9052356.1 DUF2333 family protein [Rhodobacterales bacterium HKCCD4356]NNV14343.1 DUF2333 family protein [Roseobacter sp. HKCCD7357]NNV18522.1 DUF2333 family protein [Roseobacter sp. HKCCD8768]NNV27960.1 DUF2333 family protein [Roseobacter sp. HKCCD8192]NNV32238.1 DUF2333 family protein [Roseobacter sp. HKCCD9061]
MTTSSYAASGGIGSSFALTMVEPGLGEMKTRRSFWARLRSPIGRRLLKLVVVAMVLSTTVKWTVLAPMMHEIDANVEFVPANAPEGSSAAVAMAAGLIDREINDHGWTPNDPWFFPTAPLDNMPNFQRGVMRATSWFTIELLDQIGRIRGAGANDGDLERAAGLLQFPADVWIIDPDTSWLPTATSEEQYRSAVMLLQRYNERVASGQAVFELRADALATTLRQMSVDLASQAALIDRVTSVDRRFIDTSADDLFYQNKGMLYAYYMILNSLGADFEGLIGERTLGLGWAQALEDLRKGSQLQPLFVLNADSDRSIFANHLMLQGFYMKRAILQLEEVVNVLVV